MLAVPTQVAILIAEDDEDDRMILKRAFRDCQVLNKIKFLQDGQELLDHLKDSFKGEHVSESSFLILLDLNMPRLDGREALKALKKDDVWKKIPVVVLTTSNNPKDIEYAYALGANSYFTKPLGYQELIVLVDLLKHYWLNTAKMPLQFVD